MNALVTIPNTNADIYRASTDAAGLCRDIVMKTAMKIQGRQYVKVEGWQAIAVAHGCVASAEDVHRVNDEGLSGFSAMGVIRRMSDGAEIARAEGFLGDDEKMWTGRPVYARRAMVQTRAISRACRSAFAHVVVLIDANLSTTPAEEVPDGGFDSEPVSRPAPRQSPQRGQDQPSAVVVAAKAGIDLCKTQEQLDKWDRDNWGALKDCPQPDIDRIGAHYRKREAELAKPATVNAEADEVFA